VNAPGLRAVPAFLTRAEDLARHPTRFAVVVWAASRAFYTLVGYIGTFYFRARAPGLPLEPHPHWYSPVRLLDMFVRWDALHYLTIADSGYAADGHTERVAFFPLFPLVLRGFLALGLDPMAAAVVLNHLLLLAGLVILFRAVDERVRVRLAAIILLTPATLYFGEAYPDALLFFLFAAGLVLARSRLGYAWIACAALAALASGMRPQGIALASFLFFLAIERRQITWLFASAIGALGIVAYMAYLWRDFGDPLAFVHVQSTWNRKVTLFAPLFVFFNFKDDPDHYITAFAAIFAIVQRSRRRAPWPETLMLAILVWLPLTSGRLTAFPRYFLTMIPAHLELAQDSTPVWLRRGFIAACAVYSVIDTFKLAAGYAFF
jgi:hypothetical protein